MGKDTWQKHSSFPLAIRRSGWQNLRAPMSPQRSTTRLADESASSGSDIFHLARLALQVLWNRVWQRKTVVPEGEASQRLVPPAIVGLGSLLNALDWEHVRAEVDREGRARVMLIGARGAGKSTLIGLLKGFTPVANAPDDQDLQQPTSENLGLFTVVDLPIGPNPTGDDVSAVWADVENTDLIVWMIDGGVGLRDWEREWISCVRAQGKPLIVVINKLDVLAQDLDLTQCATVLGGDVITISALTGTNVWRDLVPRMADSRPSLATALGREVPAWRRVAADRVMRRAQVLSGLTGLEPVPLLDIPFQIFIQLQLVLRIAAIYGQPLNDRYSREMVATMIASVALRYGGQEALKMIPLFGWLASGVLAAGGTWAIGRIAVEYFEHGRRVEFPNLAQVVKLRQEERKDGNNE